MGFLGMQMRLGLREDGGIWRWGGSGNLAIFAELEGLSARRSVVACVSR